MAESSQFNGFPTEGLRFLQELAENNNKEWFETNKETYQSYLLKPAQAFVIALGRQLQNNVSEDIRVDTRTNGGGVLMRIYRDTRFSKDKSPYKTNISGLFWEGAGKKMEHPAFGFQLEADGLGLMAGQFAFSKPLLKRYQEGVANEKTGAELSAILKTMAQAGPYTPAGEQYKRVPSGYDPAHERSDLLRYKGLYVHPPRLEGDILNTPGLLEQCLIHFKNMAPLQQWLVNIA